MTPLGLRLQALADIVTAAAAEARGRALAEAGEVGGRLTGSPPSARLPPRTRLIPSPSAPGDEASRAPQRREPLPTGPPGGPAPTVPTGSEDVAAAVRRAQGGEADAFAALYDRYVDVVYRYVFFRVADKSLAEDLTSETFLRALRRIESFHWQGRDFGAWLVTIARNLVADHYKSGRFRLEVTTADILDADQAEEGPERGVLDALTSAAVLTAVRQLGADQQECVVLRFLQGLSVAETAQIMNRKEGAIKALQYRAVRSLARLLPDGLQ